MDCLSEASPPCIDTILSLRARDYATRWGPQPAPPPPAAGPNGPAAGSRPLAGYTALPPFASRGHHSCPPVRFRHHPRANRTTHCPTLGSCHTLECATRRQHHEATPCSHEVRSGDCLFEDCRLLATRWLGFPCRHSTPASLLIYFTDHGFRHSEAEQLALIAVKIIAAGPAWTTEWNDNALALSAHVHARLYSLAQERRLPLHSSPTRQRARSAQPALGNSFAEHTGRPVQPPAFSM